MQIYTPPCLKMCLKRGMNEQLLKTSGTDVLSSRKKTQKNLMGGGGAGVHPLLLIRPRVKTRRYSPREQHSELPFFKRPQSMCLNTAIVFSNPQGIFSFSFYGLNASSVSICQGIATNEWQRAKVFPLSFILFLLPLRSLLGHVITMFWSGHLDNETVT